jgi:hypothetical protein
LLLGRTVEGRHKKRREQGARDFHRAIQAGQLHWTSLLQDAKSTVEESKSWRVLPPSVTLTFKPAISFRSRRYSKREGFESSSIVFAQDTLII